MRRNFAGKKGTALYSHAYESLLYASLVGRAAPEDLDRAISMRIDAPPRPSPNELC